MRSVDDLHAKARIRTAAIDCFGREGFDVSVRTIAAAAEVSPALVLHHFGSKDGLREVCDDFVLTEIRRTKTEAMAKAQPGGLLHALAQVDESVPLLAYAVRSLQAGGALAREFVERMIADARRYMREGEAAGTVKPSRDCAARDRLMVLQSLGMILVLAIEQTANGNPLDARRLMNDAINVSLLPTLEVYTHGLFTSDEMLNQYLSQLGEPPTDSGDDGG